MRNVPSLILVNPLGSDDAQRIGLSIQEYPIGSIVTVNDFAAVTLIRTGYALAYGTGEDVLLTGDAPPNDSIGTDGQWYLDTQSEVLWGPKTSGYWPNDPIRPDRGVAHFEVDADGHLQMTYTTGTTVDLGRIRFEARGPWQPQTAYEVDDLVTADNSVFRVTVAHTSGDVPPTRDDPGPDLELWVGYPDVPTATTTDPGAIVISGDLAGTWDNITVPALATLADADTAETQARADADTAEATARQQADALLIPLTQKGVAGGVATLDAGGLIPTGQLPALAISDVFTVDNEAEMLALTAQVGDVAIRTDGAGTFILAVEPASTLDNWKQLAAAAGSGPGGTGSDQGTISVEGADGSVPFAIDITSNWGVTDAGAVYYDPAGAATADAGLLVPDPDRNGFAIFRPGGPWPTEDTRVAGLMGQAANGSVPASKIRAALDARWSVYWGAGTVFPVNAALKTGDTFQHTNWGLHFYNGTTWRQRGRHELTDAQRVALPTAGLYAGYQVFCTDTGFSWQWSGTKWGLTGDPKPTGQLFGTGNATIPNSAYTTVPLTLPQWTVGMTTAADGRLTALVPGLYECSGVLLFSGASGGRRYAGIYKNGALYSQSQNRSDPNTVNTHVVSTATITIPLAVGDYVQLAGFQDTGGGLTSDMSQAFLQATWTGPLP